MSLFTSISLFQPSHLSIYLACKQSTVSFTLSNFHFLQLHHKMSLIEQQLSYLDCDMRQGTSEPNILTLNPVFFHLPIVGSKQLCVLVHLGCTSAAGSSYLPEKQHCNTFKVCNLCSKSLYFMILILKGGCKFSAATDY